LSTIDLQFTGTSKLTTTAEVYGRRGEFLASVAALSLLSISSHHHLHHSHNAIYLKNSVVISRQIPAATKNHLVLFKHGTRVTVQDLFGNMPVRVKQRSLETGSKSTKKSWEELVKNATSLLLAWPGEISMTLKDTASDRKLKLRGTSTAMQPGTMQTRGINVSRMCNLLNTSKLLSSIDTMSWVTVNASTPRLTIHGAISLKPSPTKGVQFISIGIHPLSSDNGLSLFYEEINRLFANSSFGCDKLVAPIDVSEQTKRYKNDGIAIKELKDSRKGADRWPVFCFKVDLLDENGFRFQQRKDEDPLHSNMGTLRPISDLLQAIVLEFLKSNHFVSKARIVKVPLQSIVESSLARQRIADSTDAVSSVVVSSNVSEIPRTLVVDDLVSNIKLPSFQRTRHRGTESPFDSWSRIKTGRVIHPNKIQKACFESSKSLSCKLVDNSPTGNISETDILGHIYLQAARKHDSRKSGQLIEPETGKLSRAPFENLEVGSCDTTPLNVIGITEQRHDAGADSLVEWLDPITKKIYVINARTGLSIPKNKTTFFNDADLSSRPFAYRFTPVGGWPGPSSSEPSPWVANVFQDWENPIFLPTEIQIPRLALEGLNLESHEVLRGHHHKCSQLDVDKAFKNAPAGFPGRLSKESLRNAEVVAQIDKKFILIRLNSELLGPWQDSFGSSRKMLVIVDQHAADERCRVEDLLAELCSEPKVRFDGDKKSTLIPGVNTTRLKKPINFEVSHLEAELLQSHSQYFADWGILYDLPFKDPTLNFGSTHENLVVRSLPPGIVERCRMDPKLLIELVRTEIWKRNEDGAQNLRSEANRCDSTGDPNSTQHSWLERVHKCPQGILDMLKSRSCRSAIMFNDELSSDQCKALLSRLADCAFPFQCAHGRPSMVPLLDLGALEGQGTRSASIGGSESEHFGTSFKHWKKSLG
jgi:DNA mismatch repair protein MLH3